MEQLNKEALSKFMDNVITPVLVENGEKLKFIEENSFVYEDAVDRLPFIERRNIYKLQEKIKELYGLPVK